MSGQKSAATFTYPSMPGPLRALCPDFRGVITGIRPYARYQTAVATGHRIAYKYPSSECGAYRCQRCSLFFVVYYWINGGRTA
eukprot:COSAG02_NODE_5006_length_4726_cov_21.452021_2_plen_83_part_00